MGLGGPSPKGVPGGRPRDGVQGQGVRACEAHGSGSVGNCAKVYGALGVSSETREPHWFEFKGIDFSSL